MGQEGYRTQNPVLWGTDSVYYTRGVSAGLILTIKSTKIQGMCRHHFVLHKRSIPWGWLAGYCVLKLDNKEP